LPAIFKITKLSIRCKAVGCELDRQRSGNRRRGLLPWRTSSADEQDETPIEQIQRRDALIMPLEPQVRHPRTRQSGELFWLVQQLVLGG
jgi:hypothetical protein